MANLGRKGPYNALVPYDPVPRTPTRGEDGLEETIEQLGFNGDRRQLKDSVCEEYDRICGAAGETVMTEELFVAAAAQNWGINRRAARAFFHAADVNGSSRLEHEEYLLLKETFFTEEPSAHPVIKAILLRALFHKHVLGRPAQRSSASDMTLTKREARELIRDLCACDTHVRQVAQKVMPKLECCPEAISADDFVQMMTHNENIREQCQAQGFTERDIKDCVLGATGPHGHFYSRVVLDGRAETAFMATGRSERRGIESGYVPADAVNADMELDPTMRAVGGWRGPLAPGREANEFVLAQAVVEEAVALTRRIAAAEIDELDQYWMPGNAALERLLGEGEMKQAQGLQLLAASCQRQLAAQPPLVRVPAPAKIFGDIHGQLRDLLLLFGHYGMPSHCGGDIQTTCYVFNGDWVDRGAHQLDVVCLLFALKTMYPSQVFLIRGNHEFRNMSVNMAESGFLHHIQQRLPSTWKETYEAIHTAFDWLPLAALVGGKVLVLHGGLGDGSWGLADIEATERPMSTLQQNDACVLNLLWSDPSDCDATMAQGVHLNEDRGDYGIHRFGPDITEKFCRREGIHLVVRSHQWVRQGYKVMHSGHLITLFSARNYLAEECSENDGAILLLAKDLNGHLRVHPKRLARTQTEPVPESLLSQFMRRWTSCWEFLGASSAKKPRKLSMQEAIQQAHRRRMSSAG